MKSATILIVVLVASIGANVARGADLCPIYLYGQWNGVYYYYCLPKANCTGSPQPGQATTQKTTGACAIGCDFIVPFVLTTKADPAPSNKDREKLSGFMKPRKAGGHKGQGPDDLSTFSKEEHPNKTDHSSSSDDYVLKVEAQEGDRYFRVLELHVDRIPGPVGIGQELENQPPQGTRIEVAEITYSQDKYKHHLKLTAGDMSYRVMTRREMTKK